MGGNNEIHDSTMNNNKGGYLIQIKMDIKQEINILSYSPLKKIELKIHYIIESFNTRIRTIKTFIIKGKQ